MRLLGPYTLTRHAFRLSLDDLRSTARSSWLLWELKTKQLVKCMCEDVGCRMSDVTSVTVTCDHSTLSSQLSVTQLIVERCATVACLAFGREPHGFTTFELVK